MPRARRAARCAAAHLREQHGGPATGTIQLKATFDNADNALWPGQFVTVALTLTRQPHAVVVPAHAVQNGQKGQYVFVVKADNTGWRPARWCPGRPTAATWWSRSGLQAGERVVTDGQLRLVPGARVDAKMAAPEPARGRCAQGAGWEGRWMSTDLFIRRPVMTTLLMAGILAFGIMAYRLLPVSDLPNIDL